MNKSPGQACPGLYHRRIIRPVSKAASILDLADFKANAYNPDMIEYGIVGLFLLLAVLHVLRRIARSARGCGAGCGCHGSSPRTEDRLGKRIDLIQLGATPERNSEKAT